MASEQTLGFQPRGRYNKHVLSISSNVFFDNEVKKDSEIQLSDIEIQPLVPSRDLVMIQSDSPQSCGGSPDKSNMTAISSANSQYQSETLSNKISEASKMPDEYKLSQSRNVCMTCYKGFRNKSQLTQHELVHSNVRKHVCQYCQKSFKQVSHLNQHTRSHTGERPYRCFIDGCGRSFAQLSNLNHHKKNHEEHVRRDVSRQFRCEVCDRSYASNISLITHVQKLHSNFKPLESGSPSLSHTTTVKDNRKRKKNSSEFDTTIVKTEPDFNACGDDDLSSQAKVNSHFGQNAGLTDGIGPPTSSDDQNSSRSAPRTNLPIPFSLPFHSYHQGQGHVSSFTSNPASISQSHGHGHQFHTQPPHLSNNINDIQNPPSTLSQIPSQSTHMFKLKSEPNDTQDDRFSTKSITSHDSIHAEQRALMQVAVSQRDNNYANKQHHIDSIYSHKLESVSNNHFIQRESMLTSNHLSDSHTQQPDHILHRVMSSGPPSHLAHHYPASSEMSEGCENTQIYRHGFKDEDRGNRHEQYNQGQY